MRTFPAMLAAASWLAACTCGDPSGPGADAGSDAGDDAAPPADSGPWSDAGPPPGPCDEPCPGALACCSDGRLTACRDLATDPASCGACGAPCPADAPRCVDGACVPCESLGQTTCDGACTSLELDDANCGACGHGCADGEQCIAGACQGGECVRACAVLDGAGAVCCYDGDGRPSCTDLRNDRHHCGACGTDCGSAGRCDGGPGRCVCDEVPGRVVRCGEDCRAVADDESNCGDCGVVCPADAPVCVEGRCVDCASMGLTDCGRGDCVDLATDERACGDCGLPCAPGQECIDGGCVAGDCLLPCDALLDRGPICCDDACTSLLEDPRHCGGCGRDCGEAARCEGGACLCPLGADVASCDGLCVDLDTNPSHCGGCGIACGPGAPRCLDAGCTSCEAMGLTECGAADCADTTSDHESCGACGAACAREEQCVQGACVRGECNDCDEDLGVCCAHPGARAQPGCTDLSTDFWNCGACNHWCDDGQSCVGGLCLD